LSREATLLEAIQGLLERTYAMRSGVREVGRFLVGDAGYRRFYGDGVEPLRRVESPAVGARLLVRDSGGALRASIYYPDELVRRLERRPPQHGLCDENVDPFAALVEELDHLLVVAERSRLGRPVSLFELELHANVSKHLVLERFLAGSRGRLDRRRRIWLRHHLFEKGRFCDEDREVRARYRDATRWAVKFIDALGAPSAGRRARRLSTLRRFHHVDAGGKIELIARLAS